MSIQYDELSPGSPSDVLDHPAHNHADRQQLAGDVVSLPINPGPNAGKPPLTELSEGQKQARDPSSGVVNHPSREQWQTKIKQRM